MSIEQGPRGPAAVGLVEAVMRADPWRMEALAEARRLALPDWGIGAGFVRNAVWDRLHGFEQPTPLADIDLLYFDASDLSPDRESICEAKLSGPNSGTPWEVRNQARMHLRNGDAPYRSTADALCYWLETVTAVAVRLETDDKLTVLAPLGLDDLMALRVRPTAAGRRRNAEYSQRMRAKAWPETWPGLRVEGVES